ncbi:MAG TPA: D-alanyl-D-alanine carboxypeptidase/D-alanyl-D-alanine-endopeptidase [Pyrinomonadaceae bacterium]
MGATHQSRRTRRARGAAVAALFLLTTFTSVACRDSSSSTGANEGAALPAESAAGEDAARGGRAARTAEETRKGDAALTAELDRQIDERGPAAARWGISVVSLRDGRVLYERDAGRLFTPASVMKVYTTAVALDTLGADYRWRTSVYAVSAPTAGGTIEGDLVLYGRGAPDLTSRDTRAGPSQLDELAEQLRRRGVRRVRGDVVGDESYFRGETLGEGWLWQDVQWYYGAEPSALTVDGNEITVSVAPGANTDDPVEVKTVPPTDYLRVTNDMRTVERGGRPRIGITRGLSSNDVRVWGEFPAGGPPYGVRLSVHRPALLAARLLRAALRSRGIEVAGEARSVDARVPEDERLDSDRAVELAHVLSRTLGEVVRETNKESVNLDAELILRAVGRERGDTAPAADERRTRQRDTVVAGLAVVRRWLEGAGLDTEPLALHDGSGLSRFDLVTPEATARLLAHISKTPSAAVFRDSLPVSGRDGTLQGRLRQADPPIEAKTGTLVYVNGLAGYATTADGERLAFAIFCNDKTESQSSLRAIDAVALTLTRYPRPAELR